MFDSKNKLKCLQEMCTRTKRRTNVLVNLRARLNGFLKHLARFVCSMMKLEDENKSHRQIIKNESTNLNIINLVLFVIVVVIVTNRACSIVREFRSNIQTRCSILKLGLFHFLSKNVDETIKHMDGHVERWTIGREIMLRTK